MNRAKREKDRERKWLSRTQGRHTSQDFVLSEQYPVAISESHKAYSPKNLTELVGDDTTEIPDDIILACLNLMKAHTSDQADTIVGYYTPAELLVLALQPPDSRNHIPLNKNYILIHLISNHWVTSYYKSSTRQLLLYDSLKSQSHFEETKRQLFCVYDNILVQQLKYTTVKQQNSFPICGALAIAFSVTLFLGQNPEIQNYDLSCLRQHIRFCLSNGGILPFPTERHIEQNKNDYQDAEQCLLKTYFQQQHLQQILHAEKTKMKNDAVINKKDENVYKTSNSTNISKETNLKKLKDSERKRETRRNKSPQTIERQREKDRKRKQETRQQMSLDKLEKDRQQDNLRKKTVREKRSFEQMENDKQQDTLRKKTARDKWSFEDKQKDNLRKKTVREKRSFEQMENDKQQDSLRKKTARDKWSFEDKQKDNLRKKTVREKRSTFQLKRDRQEDTLRKKIVRDNRSSVQIEKEKQQDSLRKKSVRENKSSFQIENEKQQNSLRKKSVRENRSSVQIEKDKQQDSLRKKSVRENRSSVQIEKDKQQDSLRKKSVREKRASVQIEKYKQQDSLRKKSVRENRASVQIEKEKQQDSLRKKSVREKRSSVQIENEKQQDSLRKKSVREKRSSIQIEKEKKQDSLRKKSVRENRASVQIEKEKQQDSLRKKSSRENRSSVQIDKEKQQDSLRKKSGRENRSSNQLNQERLKDRKRKTVERSKKNENEKFDEKAVVDEFKKSINTGPTFVCTCCWRLLYRRSVIQANKKRYENSSKDLVNKCFTNKLLHNKEWICHTCDKKLLAGKLPPQAQANNMTLTALPNTLRDLSQLELQLILKIIPFMKIVAMPRGAQHGLRGQVVLVPADLSKVSRCLPRPTHESQIIALALKRRLSDKHSVVNQYIRPEFVTNALAVLKQIHPMYKDVKIRPDWLDMSKECDSQFLKAFSQKPEQLNRPVIDGQIEEAKQDTEDDTILDSEDEVDEDNPKTFVTDLEYSRAVNTQTCIQPVSGPEIKTNQVLNLAPGEGATPLSKTKEPHWESMAFPNLFPTGKNTYHTDTPRPTRITAKQYINARLLCSDTRFAESPEYTFAALDWLERDAISQNINITTRKHFQQDLSVGQLKDPLRVSRLLSENHLFTTFRNIRGSPQYFKQMHLDMMAKIRQLGPYTFFLTGSAAEFHWPEVIKVVALQYGENLSDTDIVSMNWETKRRWLERNPVTVARQIDYIFEQLWGKVILSGIHPIGQVLNYDLRKEMQGRGTAHFHSAIHVKNAPKLDIDSDRTFIEFADKYIKCQLPDKELDPEFYQLVLSRQSHHHTRTCKKNKECFCRFGFPKCPSDETVISRVPTDENAKSLKSFAMEILSKMYKQLATLTGEPPTLDSLLDTIGVRKEDYNTALKVSSKRTQIMMKRNTSSIYINNYNPLILRCLMSNMDIQMITSVWACIAYIASYICKPEKNMSELMRKASKEASNKTIRDKLFTIGDTLRKGREVSHHEAIMKLLSIPLRRSNTQVQFISTDYKHERTRILKPKSVILAMEDNDTDIYVPGIHEKYAARPQSLNHLSLAEFVADYSEKSYTTGESNTEEEEAEVQEEVNFNAQSSTVVLPDHLGKLYKRKKTQVIRYHYVSKEKDEELYYHRLLLLYFPWKKEEDFKSGTYKQFFENHKADIMPIMQKFEPYYEEVETVLETFDPQDLQGEIWNEVAAQIEQDRQNPNNKHLDPDRAFLDTNNLPELPEIQPQKNSFQQFSLTACPLMTDPQFYSHIQSLNTEQRHIFDFVLWWATCIRHTISIKPFYIFLTGGAGVGKSHVIHAVFEAVTRTLRTPGQNPDLPTVLLTASTGKAAANINGLTLHSAFGLPVKDNTNKKTQYRKPGAEKLNTLRSNYTNLKLIIADEISMFGAKNLSNLSLALQDIFEEYSVPFAGISILAVGDLLQLNPVGDRPIFKHVSDGYDALAGSLWTQYFKLYELQTIVRQKNDPCFAQILSRIRTGDFTDGDEKCLLDLEHTDTSNFGSDTINIFMYNKQVDAYNEDHIKVLPGIHTIQAVDSRRDNNTNTVLVTVPETSINNTGNLPSQLTIAPGAKVMLTKNIDILDHLVNGIIGKVTEIHLGNQSLKGTIYVDFDDQRIGKNAKAHSPRHLKNCVPIQAVSCTFSLQKPSAVTVERTMFPLILAYAITSHKSQGSTYRHVVANLEVPENVKTVFPGQVYTILSRATSRDGLKLTNFTRKKVVVNKEALNEIKEMRLTRRFQWAPPISSEPHNIGFLNIRSLPAHHADLESDHKFKNLSVLCLSETHVKPNLQEFHISNFNTFYKSTPHGLAILVRKGIPSWHVDLQHSNMEIIARLVQLNAQKILVVCVYKPPNSPKSDFVQTLTNNLAEKKSDPIVLGGDFNTEPIDLSAHLKLIQKIDQPTHTHGRTLDHIYVPETMVNHEVGVFPVPYTDHMLTLIHI